MALFFFFFSDQILNSIFPGLVYRIIFIYTWILAISTINTNGKEIEANHTMHTSQQARKDLLELVAIFIHLFFS